MSTPLSPSILWNFQLLKIKVDFIDNIAYVNNYHIKWDLHERGFVDEAGFRIASRR